MTHEQDGRWPYVAPPELGVVSFGKGENCGDQVRPRHAYHEWRKGGQIIAWLEHEQVSAILMLGYNDLGRLRILRWCRRKGVPCFIWGDSNIKGDSTHGGKAFLKRFLLPPILRHATGVFACGRLGKDYFARYGVSRSCMFLFPNEPDYELITRTTAGEVEETRRRFHLGAERRRLVYSGRLSPEKRVGLLIDAFAQVAAERPQWDLLILGDGGLRAN